MESGVKDLISAWSVTSLDGPDYLLPGDDWLRKTAEHAITEINGYRAFADGVHLGDLGGKRLHLNLIPMPYLGDLRHARVCILMANPGVQPADYYFEESYQQYGYALRQNLRQARSEYPLLFLDPLFACTGGGAYWRGRLACALAEWCRQKNVDYRKALKSIATRVAVLQLVPYHSREFYLSKEMRVNLGSVQLALDCARELKRERHLIVVRAVRDWNLNPASKRIVRYTPGAALGASLSCSSQGWSVLLAGLGLRSVRRCPIHASS